ncbi:MAG: hypothetical protein H6Q16_1095 [Bacteroidetes bacterium]|nr:hypothetical protein [Bacteroidota bacterium]
MKSLNFRIIIVLISASVLMSACNRTSDKITRYINRNCDFKKTDVFFHSFDSTSYTAPADYIDLKKALKVDYDTLYLISAAFEEDISEIIGFPYHGGDFTVEAEDRNLLLLVKQNKVVYKGTIKFHDEKATFVYPMGNEKDYFPNSACILKHSSSIYKVHREKDGWSYRYYLYNIEK